MNSKTKKWILLGCGSIVSLIVLFIVLVCGIFFYLTRDNRIATDPERIANEANFDLPAYIVVSQNDNMDRGASAWSSYSWDLILKEPLSEKNLKKLDKLVDKDSHWHSYQKDDEKVYIYDIEEEDRIFSIEINVDKRKVYMYYEWWDILS